MALIDNIQYIDSASIQVATLEYASTKSGSFTGSLFGTSSFATTASYVSSASFATTTITSSQGTKAWGYFSFNGTTLVTSTYGCSVTRAAVGSYNVLFSQVAPTSLYSVQCSGHSGSVDASATGSIGWAYKQATTGFTMSFVKMTVLTRLADVTTASFVVLSY